MKPICKIGNRKVVIIGAGFVGSSIAYALALRDIAREIVLLDINVENYGDDKLKGFNKSLITIIYDNSTTIGNNNEIKSSSFKS